MSAQLELIPHDVAEAIALQCSGLFRELECMPLDDRVSLINRIRLELSKYSPFRTEPVDCVQWIKAENVHANDYNPNSVAPPEMELLRTSIRHDGYTQPIVGMLDENVSHEVIVGFHRDRVG